MALRDQDVINVRGSGTLHNSGPLHDRLYNWLLTICAMPHAALVADLRNPTIRKSLVAFHDVLATYGHGWLHERAVDVLGSDRMEQARLAPRCLARDRGDHRAQPGHY